MATGLQKIPTMPQEWRGQRWDWENPKMNARPQIREKLLERKMRRWRDIARYPLLDVRCPPARARKNFWRTPCVLSRDRRPPWIHGAFGVRAVIRARTVLVPA